MPNKIKMVNCPLCGSEYRKSTNRRYCSDACTLKAQQANAAKTTAKKKLLTEIPETKISDDPITITPKASDNPKSPDSNETDTIKYTCETCGAVLKKSDVSCSICETELNWEGVE